MQDLWDSDAFVDDNTLTVNINRLRTTLENWHQRVFDDAPRPGLFGLGAGYVVCQILQRCAASRRRVDVRRAAEAALC